MQLPRKRQQQTLLEIEYRCVTQILIFSQTLTDTKNMLLPSRGPPFSPPLASSSFSSSPFAARFSLLLLPLCLVSPFALLHFSWFSLVLSIISPFSSFLSAPQPSWLYFHAACFSCFSSLVPSLPSFAGDGSL